MSRWLPFALLMLAIGCDDCGEDEPDPVADPLPGTAGLRSVADFADIADEEARSVALFEEMGKVLTHPRCVNCHPIGERPLQRAGEPHQPHVVRGEDGHGAPGLPCASCHGESHFRTVPGNPEWHLAPAEMAWEGKSFAALCAQIQDPERNGGKDMDALLEHMEGDALVAYGWDPPEHLEAVPGSQALFGQLAREWAATGAHCPPEPATEDVEDPAEAAEDEPSTEAAEGSPEAAGASPEAAEPSPEAAEESAPPGEAE